MFYHLLYPLHSIVPGFNVFRYLTFRIAYAILTGLIISLILGPWVIRQLRRYQIGETIRADGPKSHQNKAGTPTMGGVADSDGAEPPDDSLERFDQSLRLALVKCNLRFCSHWVC